MDMKEAVSILKREKRKTIQTKDKELYNALVLAIGCIEGTMDNKAHWICSNDYWVKKIECSHCGFTVSSQNMEDFHFCPLCGAYMSETK